MKTVAIVGRPNVGKSTFFNRLIGERKSIIDNQSGVTRDRIYGTTVWNGKEFSVIDTGGYVKGSDDIFEEAIRRQVNIAMDEADIIIFLVDVMTGVTDLDDAIAKILRRSPKNIILAVNKVDNNQRQLMANEFWSLGFEDTFFLAAISGSGSGELLDRITELLPEEDNEDKGGDDIPRIAILGQPNVGKSSFTNALLGEERNIVTNLAGTTRDSIHTKFNKFGRELLLIDTAGIRKKAKVHEDLEFYSVIRAFKAIDEADVCILMIDATLGIESQDMSIFGQIVDKRKGVIVVVNKWDLFLEKKTNSARDFEDKLKRKMAPFNDVPVIFTSVYEKQRIIQTLDLALEVYNNRTKRIKTSELNNVMLKAIEHRPPPSDRGRFIQIKYVTQLPVYYPAFAFFCNHPKHIKASYKGYLENKLREYFDFEGVPISVYFREK